MTTDSEMEDALELFNKLIQNGNDEYVEIPNDVRRNLFVEWLENN